MPGSEQSLVSRFPVNRRCECGGGDSSSKDKCTNRHPLSPALTTNDLRFCWANTATVWKPLELCRQTQPQCRQPPAPNRHTAIGWCSPGERPAASTLVAITTTEIPWLRIRWVVWCPRAEPCCRKLGLWARALDDRIKALRAVPNKRQTPWPAETNKAAYILRVFSRSIKRKHHCGMRQIRVDSLHDTRPAGRQHVSSSSTRVILDHSGCGACSGENLG